MDLAGIEQKIRNHQGHEKNFTGEAKTGDLFLSKTGEINFETAQIAVIEKEIFVLLNEHNLRPSQESNSPLPITENPAVRTEHGDNIIRNGGQRANEFPAVSRNSRISNKKYLSALVLKRFGRRAETGKHIHPAAAFEPVNRLEEPVRYGPGTAFNHQHATERRAASSEQSGHDVMLTAAYNTKVQVI